MSLQKTLLNRCKAMIIFRTVLITLVLSTSAAFAALPPLAQSSREIQAILESPEAYQLLGGAEPINKILRCDNRYIVFTASKELWVDVHYLKNGKIGPAEFKLEFHLAALSDG